jgi:hypothetical protein
MDNFREKGSSIHNVMKIIIHEEWNPDAQNYDADIALLRIKKPIQFNEYVKPICIFKPNDVTGSISNGWLVGYGDSANIFPRKLELPILETNACLRIESGYRSKISPRMFCAGSKAYTNICGHDMGDGLFVKFKNKYFLAGIASYVLSKRHSNCDFKNAALFTNAHLMSQWILSYVRPNQNQQQNHQVNALSNQLPYQPSQQQLQSQRPQQYTQAPQYSYSSTTKKIDNDNIFFPPDDDYNFSKGPVGFTTKKTTYSNNNKPTTTPSYQQSGFGGGEPTFDILATGRPQQSIYNQGFTEKPVFNKPMNIEQTAFEYDCGKMKPLKLANGGKTEWNEFPWTATIIQKGKVANFVIGSLLSYRHVFVDLEELNKLGSQNDLQVYLGLNNINKITSPGGQYSPTVVDVEKVIKHPTVSKIGIILLANPIEYGKKIFPICLLDTKNQISATNAYQVGFDNDDRMSSVFKLGNVNECSQKYRNLNVNEATCAKRTSNCLSKATSSLYVNNNNIWYLLATPKSVKSSCALNQPEIFDNLKTYTGWLQTTIVST